MTKPTNPWDFDQAACAEVGGNMFFPRDYDDNAQSRYLEDFYKTAKRICQTCEHIQECAEWGIANETIGVWGGLSPADRNKIRRNSRARSLPIVAINGR